MANGVAGIVNRQANLNIDLKNPIMKPAELLQIFAIHNYVR